MAYRSRRRRSSYRRGTVSSRRETFTNHQWGSFGLTSDNQEIEGLDLLRHYQQQLVNTQAGVDVEKATILGVRGWITFYNPSPGAWSGIPDADSARIFFGIRTMSESAVAGLNALTERQIISPYRPSGKSPWDAWMWRRSRPIANVETTPVTEWLTRFPVNVRNMRKLRGMGESLYLFGGVNFDPGSGGDIQVTYDLDVYCAKP